MKYEFRVTFLQQLLVLSFCIIFTGFLIILHYKIFGFEYRDILLLVIDFCLLTVNLFSVIIVHIQYLIINWHAELIIDKNRSVIRYEKANNVYEYLLEDIDHVIYYQTVGPNPAMRSRAWYPMAPYRYYKIVFKDKKEIIITCLMINDIENTLPDLIEKRAKLKLRLVPFVY